MNLNLLRSACALLWLAMGLSALAQGQPAPFKFESEIAAFEKADATKAPQSGGILFVGSSSIRLWKTLAEDFPGLNVINRGFGGSHIEDSTAMADRIVVRHKPRAIFLYAGDNDIAAGKSPERVFADFKAFEEKVRAALPEVQIAYIAIKPSPSRWALADKVREANRLIRDHAERTPRLRFVDVYTPMIGADGLPRASLFVSDRLHMNAKGYALWTALVRAQIDALGESGPAAP